MGMRERLLTLRLLERLRGNPEYARKLKLEIFHFPETK